jgi:hypothetical protein
VNIRLAVLILALGGWNGEQLVATETRAGDLPNRSLSALRADVRAALRAEAISRRQGANPVQVVRLIELYREMAAHPQRDECTLLAELGRLVQSRLKKIAEHIERRHQRSRTGGPETAQDAVVAGAAPHVLAQQVAAPAGVAAAGQAVQPVAPQAAGARMIDYGPELVELIQRTISPEVWDINGGNSSIVYFAPLRVLVVNAPGTVHGQVGGVLGQLRAAP